MSILRIVKRNLVEIIAKQIGDDKEQIQYLYKMVLDENIKTAEKILEFRLLDPTKIRYQDYERPEGYKIVPVNERLAIANGFIRETIKDEFYLAKDIMEYGNYFPYSMTDDEYIYEGVHRMISIQDFIKATNTEWKRSLYALVIPSEFYKIQNGVAIGRLKYEDYLLDEPLDLYVLTCILKFIPELMRYTIIDNDIHEQLTKVRVTTLLEFNKLLFMCYNSFQDIIFIYNKNHDDRIEASSYINRG